jgi:hypothetical protein
LIDENYRDSKIVIVTGDEPKGVDRLAKEYAQDHNIPCIIKIANWPLYRLAAGPIRNSEMVVASDIMVAFPSKTGKGTQDSIAKMERAGKRVIVVEID